MDGFIGITFIFFLGFVICKVFRKSEDHNDNDESETVDDGIAYNELSDHINSLNSLKENVDRLDDMITNIKICSPDQELKNITISVPDNRGNNVSYKFIVDGEDIVSAYVLEILNAERLKLRSSLNIEARKYSDRCNGNCNGNYDVLGSRGVVK